MMGREERQNAHMLDSLLSRRQSGEGAARFSPNIEGGQARETGALVDLALQVKEAFNPTGPGPAVSQRVQRKLLLALKERRAELSRPIRPFQDRRLRVFPALLGLLLVLGMLSASVGVVGASASSLPGDLLYPVKTGVEDVRLALTFSSEGKLSLITRYSEERSREMAALSEAGRYQDLEAAAASYSNTLDTMFALRESFQASGELASASALDEILIRQVETLLRVQEQVPGQAAGAIQGVLERALERGQGQEKPEQGIQRETPGPDRQATQTVKAQERQEAKDMQTAQQIAKKYGLSTEEVLGLYHASCAGDWKCVREVYRELEKEK